MKLLFGHFAIPWTAAYQASLSLTISRSLPKFMSTELVKPVHQFLISSSLLIQLSPSLRTRSQGLSSSVTATPSEEPMGWL